MMIEGKYNTKSSSNVRVLGVEKLGDACRWPGLRLQTLTTEQDQNYMITPILPTT
jgi:hypothetical protein